MTYALVCLYKHDTSKFMPYHEPFLSDIVDWLFHIEKYFVSVSHIHRCTHTRVIHRHDWKGNGKSDPSTTNFYASNIIGPFHDP